MVHLFDGVVKNNIVMVAQATAEKTASRKVVIKTVEELRMVNSSTLYSHSTYLEPRTKDKQWMDFSDLMEKCKNPLVFLFPQICFKKIDDR